MNGRTSNYDKRPSVAVPNTKGTAVASWTAVAERLRAASTGGRTICIDAYPGVDVELLLEHLKAAFETATFFRSDDALKTPAEIDAIVAPFLGGGDPIFGFMTSLQLPALFDDARLGHLRDRIAAAARSGLVVVVGIGASLFANGGLVVLADMARWEIQKRQRRNEIGNLGADNRSDPASLKYKRAYFIDWRIADRWKTPLLPTCDFLLDTNDRSTPKLVTGDAFRRGLIQTTRRPFRVVPFFDPGPWGGQWMKSVCGLDPSESNYAWCFDGVPEENSLLLDCGGVLVEVPSLNVVLAHPRALLGDAVYARFGAEFPIRFDLLDTMGGGNLSLQVNPITDYIRQHFGLPYTQDESYYWLDAEPDACVWLGFVDDVDREACADALRAAQAGGEAFDAARFIHRVPARKHDHFLIPAGTVHCSGKGAMVLEIRATPYIFTFKLWDWNRLGLDGQPRPINVERGLANLDWERTPAFVERELANCVEPIANGHGWREERTGLHEREFIETRRHWFTGTVTHRRTGGVEVLNLIEGSAAVVESPDGQWEPFPVHYAETFILPADAGDYTIRPADVSGAEECATLKAYVRHHA